MCNRIMDEKKFDDRVKGLFPLENCNLMVKIEDDLESMIMIKQSQ